MSDTTEVTFKVTIRHTVDEGVASPTESDIRDAVLVKCVQLDLEDTIVIVTGA